MLQVVEMLQRERRKLKADSIKEGKFKEKIKTVKNMLKENLPIDVIARVTGISEQEIRNVK